MQVAILAGGLGTRLRPLTLHVPKSMASVEDVPFLQHQLELLKRHDLSKIIMCVGYLGDKIKEYFGDGRNLGMNIQYSFEKKPLGTGGALKNAEDLLEDEFMVLNGDTFLDMDYQGLIQSFYRMKKCGMVVCFKNQPKMMKNNIEIDDKKKIIKYSKAVEEKANTVDAGVQIFKKEVLELILPHKKISLEEETYPVLIQKNQLVGYITPQKFYDIGTLKQLKEFTQIT